MYLSTFFNTRQVELCKTILVRRMYCMVSAWLGMHDLASTQLVGIVLSFTSMIRFSQDV